VLATARHSSAAASQAQSRKAAPHILAGARQRLFSGSAAAQGHAEKQHHNEAHRHLPVGVAHCYRTTLVVLAATPLRNGAGFEALLSIVVGRVQQCQRHCRQP